MAVATVLIYIGVAVFAGGAVLEARRARKQQGQISVAEARPYVFVYFDNTDAPILHLVVENVGRTAATKVRLSVDPPLDSTLDTEQRKYAAFVTKELPLLPPGQSIKGVFDSAVERFNNSGFPDRFRVSSHYEGPAVAQVFDEELILDLSHLRGLLRLRRKSLHDLVEAVEAFDQTLTRWGDQHHLRVLIKDLDAYEEEQGAWVAEFQSQHQVQPEAQSPTEPPSDPGPTQ